MTEERPAEYFYGLDTLRAALMIVGVFWHAVAPLSPLSRFVYSSEYHKSFPILATIYGEHIFRMEAFFLVSGFLALMIRERKGKSAFFQARVKRVLLPLLLGCFGVNLLLQIFGAPYMGFQWKHFDMWRWVMHGWFLITLFLCALIDMALPQTVYRRCTRLGMLLVFVIATVGYAALLYYNGHHWHFFGPVKGNLFNFFILNTVQFYPFYFAGGLLYVHRDKLARLQRVDIALIVAVALAFSLFDYLQSLRLVNFFTVLPRGYGLTYRLIHVIAAGAIAFLLFYFFFRSRRKGGKKLRYLIDSAIVIYLVHHPVVIVLAWVLDSPAYGNLTYYLLLCALTLAASYAAYEIIRRSRPLRIAFGLKTQNGIA